MSPASIAFQLAFLNKESQFSTNRYAVLFKPGTYGRSNDLLTSQVGYYEQFAGLGGWPGATTITGGFNADQLIDGNMTQNFWRSQENLSIIPSGGLTQGVLDWGVSQGTSLRRMQINGGLWLANSGPIGSANACQESSGGFIADSEISGLVNACSQQQWYTRNTALPGGFTGFVWNFVFSGDIPANSPVQSYPGGGYGDVNVTNLSTTPVSQEKPFLYMDSNGNYNVFSPAFAQNSSGPDLTANGGLGAGTSLSISHFFIATPSSTLTQMNNALATGESLILTPGIYKLSGSINVTNPNAIVLGMGYATLVPQTGAPAITVADVDGVKIAGVLIDAGPVESPVLMEVGSPGVVNKNHAGKPTVLSDVFFRIGGATAGSAITSLQVDSPNVILDNIWAWRADHGNAGTFGWNVNPAAHGVVINGSGVTALGLAVEHYQQEQVLWNGDGGETIFYQSELPYDPPSQEAWSNGAVLGYPSYAVSSGVCTHKASGLGIYSYFDQGVNIIADNAMTVPDASGIDITDAGTVFLNGTGQISNIVNGFGGSANVSNSGTLNALASYVGNGPCVSGKASAPGSTVPEATIANPNPNNWNTANIMWAIYHPHPDLVTVAAHRGIHALAGTDQAPNVPENSLQAIGLAAQAGWESIEIDVKLTSDGVPILSHDQTWGREWCSYNGSFFAGAFDPFSPLTGTNAYKDPAVNSLSLSQTRSVRGGQWGTYLRDSVSLYCSPWGAYTGVYPPTLQDVYDYIRKNNIQMVVTLDIQSLDRAAAAWKVVQANKDAQGRPFSSSTIFKIPAILFDSPTTFINTFGANYTSVNFNPVFHTAGIAPKADTTGDDIEDVSDLSSNPTFGSEQAMINWINIFRAYNQTGPIKIAAIEVSMKDPLPNGILSSVLPVAQMVNPRTKLPTMTISQFNPVGEYYNFNGDTSGTPYFFSSKNGTCCEKLSQFLYNNPNNTGPIDPTQPYDHADNRPSDSFLVGMGAQMITTDLPSVLTSYLKSRGMRNISYMQSGFTPPQ